MNSWNINDGSQGFPGMHQIEGNVDVLERFGEGHEFVHQQLFADVIIDETRHAGTGLPT